MKVLDLFSGIGGFALSGHWAGMTTAAFCEIDPFCQKVLNKNFPKVPIYDNVRAVTRKQLEKDGVMSESDPIRLICGGIPCQPFSVAGKQKGTDDERHLWPEMYRIIQEVRPTWVLVENVTGFIKLALDLIINDLENEGYQTGAFVIPASSVGAPHQRNRIFIVAYSDSIRREQRSKEYRILPKMQGNKSNIDKFKRSGKACKTLANSTGIRQQGQGEFIESINTTKISERKASESINVCIRQERSIESRLGGVLDGISFKLDEHRWPAGLGLEQYDWEPPRVAEGVKDRKDRLRALGNTVVPQVVYPILKAIMETE
jgi:DNA (cytosine-5)-methyltransferase 1